METKKIKKNKGFTLIEMLVAIAIFSIVLVVALGSIMTILDANRKSQTLSLAMDNMNFALESMTRTIKTATEIDQGADVYFLEQVDEGEYGSDWVRYHHNQDRKTIEKCLLGGGCIPIISSSVEIDSFVLETLPTSFSTGTQGRVFIYLKGKAQLSPKVSTDFEIQTTISPRQLNI